MFHQLKILSEKCPEYSKVVNYALCKAFKVTDPLFLRDCHDTAQRVITREYSKLLAYHNKRFREKLRSCEFRAVCVRWIVFSIAGFDKH